MRNLINNEIKKAKAAYYHNQIQENAGNSKVPSTRIRIFLKTELFWPRENGDFGNRNWSFLKTVSRLQIFLTGYFLEPCGQRKTEVLQNDDIKCRGQAKTIWRRYVWTRNFFENWEKKTSVFKISRYVLTGKTDLKTLRVDADFFRKRE